MDSQFSKPNPPQYYTPLPHQNGVEEKLLGRPESSDDELPVQDAKASNGTLSTWTLWGCIFCTLLNVILFAFMGPSGGGSQTTLNRNSPLPRPNQFPGLNNINRTQPGYVPPEPIINYAPILTQVSKKDKKYVFPVDPHRHFTYLGTTTSDDRHFLVNTTINSIAQFRVLDYGMELCTIILNIPTRQELESTPNYRGKIKTFELSSPAISINVWKLVADDRSFVDETKLSWNTRPLREGSDPLATLSVFEGNQAQSGRFACQSDSLQTFEFECVGKDCSADFWQDKDEPALAMFLQQSASV